MSALRVVLAFFCLSFELCSSSKPNIVFIVADDLGWNDVGFRNPQMITPKLDELATSGVILNSSYVQPVCTPSRSCFMTGYFPYHTGMQDGVIRPRSPGYVPLNFRFLPETLKELGYSTHAVGKWHLGFCDWKYTPTYRGFDSYLGCYCGADDYYNHTRDNGYDFHFNTTVHKEAIGQYSANVFTQRAIDIINSHDKSNPLYLYLPFQNVHVPFQVPKKYEDMYKDITDQRRRIYCGMVTILDEAVENITDALNETGLLDNLLLVFISDNGGPSYAAASNFPLRGAKTTLWEGGTKSTTFIYSKTLLKDTGYVNTGMIHAVDWYPTLVELAGGTPDLNMDGVSQVDLLINGGDSKREEFVYNIYQKTNSSAIRYKDLKLLRGSPGKHNDWSPLLTYNGSSHCAKVNFTFPYYMLYNITQDPTERDDLSSTHPDLVEMMKERLAEWEKSAVAAFHPEDTEKSDPDLFDGNWSPGWC